MKIYSEIAILVTFALPFGVRLQAAESFTLETRVYVYRNGDFLTIKIPDTTAADETHGVVFRSPAVAQFDQEKLSLDGATFAWSSGLNPPDRFSLIATPTVPLTAGKHLTFLSTAPIQYLEKRPDGALQVREVPGDSPEAPHCRMTFAAAPAGEPSKDLRLTCDLDIATVSARKNLSGVTLDVGKPVLASLKEKVELTVRPAEWSALLLKAPNRSDYSLLMLFKISPGQTSSASAATPQANGFKTAAELDRFVANYYRHPQPELIGRAIEMMGPTGLLADRRWIFVGFFAEVLAANPDRVEAWEKLGEKDWLTGDCLRTALKLRSQKSVHLSSRDPDMVNDLFWGEFFASGDRAFLEKLVDPLRSVDPAHVDRRVTGLMWSLASNLPAHPLVRTTLEAARTGADPRARKLIDDLLEKDPATIRQEIRAMNSGQRYEMTVNGTPTIGERDFDPGNPGAGAGRPPFHN